MHYVLIGEHSPEVCPTSNAKTRDLLLQIAPQIPKIAEKAGVKLVAGPFVNREHTVITVVEAQRGEDLDQFLVESRLAQWNRMRVLPSLPMDAGMKDVQSSTPLF
jgi:uncharacterized protein with GYD domain